VTTLPELSDGVVRIRPLAPEDAAEHLAGEDIELWRWLTEGHPGTLETVDALIRRSTASWRTLGPVRNFGVWDQVTGALAGNCEASFAQETLAPGEVNLSYAIWPTFRGRGYATRAVELLCTYLATETDAEAAVIRVDAGNTRSIAVARRSGFASTPSSEPQFLRFFRPLH
jgi:RimJ/RimL family protein N-acetyltransferase